MVEPGALQRRVEFLGRRSAPARTPTTACSRSSPRRAATRTPGRSRRTRSRSAPARVVVAGGLEQVDAGFARGAPASPSPSARGIRSYVRHEPSDEHRDRESRRAKLAVLHVRRICAPAGEARQPVVGDRHPVRRRLEPLAPLRRDPRVAVQRPEAHAHDAARARLARPHVPAADRAERLRQPVGGSPVVERVRAREDARSPRRRPSRSSTTAFPCGAGSGGSGSNRRW